ncbi:MAG TPA: hypothetical protein VFE96_07440 [Candidatus Bathyarchaeia archaeon]|nr:hypothetical protein [Candidatus Bathyarchaeia archaeon]
MRKITWLILLLDAYGITVIVLAVTGLFRPAIIIAPFVVTTPLLTSQFRKLPTDSGYRVLLLLTAAIFALTWISLLYSVYNYLT